MPAASQSIDIKLQSDDLIEHPVLADQVIYKGSVVFADSSSGYAQTNDGVTITADSGDLFLGIAYENAIATGMASGAKKMRVITRGIAKLTIAGTAAQSKVGDPVYVNNATDNSQATLNAANDGSDCMIGYLAGVDSTTVGYVMLSGAGKNKVGISGDSGAPIGTTDLRIAKATYSFATDGGAQSTITPAISPVIPNGAIVHQAIVDNRTAPVGAGASVAVQLQAANDIITAAAINGAPWSTTGLKAGTPVGTAATSIKLTADRQIKIVISAVDLTAGIFDVFVFYYVP